MSPDSEKVKRLVAFKEKLEKKVEDLDSELKDLQVMLETVNSMLLEKGFTRAEIAKEPVAPEASSLEKKEVAPEPEPSTTQSNEEPVAISPLKTVTGELLASLHVGDNSLRIVLAEDKDFDVNTPPFMHFLVERVLAKMQERDSELARTGQLSADGIFCYNIVRDGDVVREIVIKNLDADRLRELKSSVRWTLEKMYEKMKNQG